MTKRGNCCEKLHDFEVLSIIIVAVAIATLVLYSQDIRAVYPQYFSLIPQSQIALLRNISLSIQPNGTVIAVLSYATSNGYMHMLIYGKDNCYTAVYNSQPVPNNDTTEFPSVVTLYGVFNTIYVIPELKLPDNLAQHVVYTYNEQFGTNITKCD